MDWKVKYKEFKEREQGLNTEVRDLKSALGIQYQKANTLASQAEKESAEIQDLKKKLGIQVQKANALVSQAEKENEWRKKVQKEKEDMDAKMKIEKMRSDGKKRTLNRDIAHLRMELKKLKQVNVYSRSIMRVKSSVSSFL